MNVLIDTSVWVDHFRNRNQKLFELLALDVVLMHPMVLGELACGTPPAPRLRTLDDLGLLQECNQASLPEVMAFVEREQIYGMGCGLVDLTLLASTLMTPGCRLWTLDRRLAVLADHFSVAFRVTLA
ncbi:type II toxin-antitoxin system VapC family toxin [Burkholderia sola]|uniref:type II toxin-antitoxin system VapC family toxin n=1 Tax=Burkholderia sola TaxID=2843302 RepID=UPI0023DD781B|nr:PIN domain-containing protein [Burkholderia sola]MDF3080764.1 VapC toxin family PIN domain ribonuclease [Burkholderia sola]